MNLKQAREFLTNIQRTKNKKQVAAHVLNTLLEDRKNVLDLNIIVCIDISGSVTRAQYQQFMAQLDEFKGLSRIKVIETDVDIVAMYDYYKLAPHHVARLRTGGGTDYNKAITKVNQMSPDALIFMTDGKAKTQVLEPICPTGWILTHDAVQPYPFGEVIARLNPKNQPVAA